jgi:hypothetical protein
LICQQLVASVSYPRQIRFGPYQLRFFLGNRALSFFVDLNLVCSPFRSVLLGLLAQLYVRCFKMVDPFDYIVML